VTEQVTARRDAISAGLQRVRSRIDFALAESGRRPGAVVIVVVTKTFPARDVRLLAELGVRDVGENRHQEAVEKYAACADLELVWHFVGALQTNKSAAVAGYADVVHSVDRLSLVSALAKGARRADRTLRCLVQVSLDERPRIQGTTGRRSGADPSEVLEIADAVAAGEDLQLVGVMGVAPLAGDPDAAFARLADTATSVRGRHPGADMISAGMSGDLEAAVRRGATHVRVGSAVLGARPPLG
jgi:pyridoxal phosphate enzyme (YggS family)